MHSCSNIVVRTNRVGIVRSTAACPPRALRRWDIPVRNWDAVSTDDKPRSKGSDRNTAKRAGTTRLRVERGGLDCALTERCDSKKSAPAPVALIGTAAIVSGWHTLSEKWKAESRKQ